MSGSDLADRPLDSPDERRLPFSTPRRAEILAAHAGALAEGRAGYLDPNDGLFVLSAAYLAARNSCCEQGCRHCPYLE